MTISSLNSNQTFSHSNQDRIRIVIIDDRPLVYEMLKVYLEREPDLEIVGYANNGNTGLEQIKQLDPHIAIVDLEMPKMNGSVAIEIIRQHFPSTQVLVLSGHDEPEHINKAIQAGAKGYLLKGTPASGIVDAIRYVSKGYFHLGSNLLNKLVLSSLDRSSLETTEDLTSKLVEPLQHLKWEITDQCHSLIDRGLEHYYQQLTEAIELKLHAFQNQQYESNVRLKTLHRRVRLLSISQVCLLFLMVSYMMMNKGL